MQYSCYLANRQTTNIGNLLVCISVKQVEFQNFSVFFIENPFIYKVSIENEIYQLVLLFSKENHPFLIFFPFAELFFLLRLRIFIEAAIINITVLSYVIGITISACRNFVTFIIVLSPRI